MRASVAEASWIVAVGLVGLLGWMPQPARAQTDEAQLWLSSGLRFRPIRSVRIDFDQGLRFDEDISRLSEVLPELSVSYDPVRFLRLGVGYRVSFEVENEGDFEDYHRLHLDARLRGEIDRVELSYRLRFQERLWSDGGELQARHVFRNRLQIAIDTDSPFTPSLSGELFMRVGHDEIASLPKWRLTAGVTIDLDEHTLEVFYRFEAPIEDETDPRLHILGLGYRYELPRP